MECIILAAGRGTRLKELTNNRNKCTLEIGGKPIIKRIVENLKSSNIHNINIITGHFADSIKNIIKDNAHYMHNPLYEKSGILVSLLCGKEICYNKELLVSTGDIIFHPKILPELIATKGEVVIAVKKKLCVEKDVKVVVENNKILLFEENYPAEKAVGEFGMMAKFDNKTSQVLFDIAEQFISEGKDNLRLIDAFNEMIKIGYNFVPYIFEESRAIEIDTNEDLEKARELIKNFNEGHEELINIEKATAYIEKKKLFSNPKVSFIDIGNINYVYKIEDDDNIFYLKYYGIQPRRTTEAINLIDYQPSRFQNEIDAIKCLNNILDLETMRSIPKIKYCDETNKILIMSDIAENGDTLKEILLKKYNLYEIKNAVKKLAKLIGQQHSRTLRKNLIMEDEAFNKRFYDFRTIHSSKNLSKEQQQEIKVMADKIFEKNKEFSCLINADLSPKQVFVNNKGIGLCDFELLSSGIASYDIGFFIGNLKIIQIIKNDARIEEIIRDFLIEYFKTIRQELDDNKEFINFTKEYINFFIGTSILNRIDAVPIEEPIKNEHIVFLRNKATEFIFKNKEQNYFLNEL